VTATAQIAQSPATLLPLNPYTSSKGHSRSFDKYLTQMLSSQHNI
jgi:hypothetical protein